MQRYKQEVYYDIAAIEARISEALGSSEWENVKKTDLGQALIHFAANIVHLDAMAFFTGLDQFFKSTVTQAGYLEEIAKSRGVIPKTYSSANIAVSIYSKGSPMTFFPMDLMVEVGGKRFYNIDEVTIGTISAPVTVVLYEGNVVREASVVGRPLGFAWTFGKLKAVQAEKVGDRVVRRYLMLPRETFVDSITVETTVSWDIPFVRFGRVESWYGVGPNAKSWKLGKDYLGRYTVEFGDGVYGLPYPSDDIVAVKYLVSSGSIEMTNFSNPKVYSQDVNDITSSVGVGEITGFVDGRSEVSLRDLHLEIEVKETTRDALITETDYRNYLESRSDVLYASVQAERHNNPPNVEYFNTVRYVIKPNVPQNFASSIKYNDAEIQAYFAKYGLQTVEFLNTVAAYAKFVVEVRFSTLPGVAPSSVSSQINSILGSAFSWDSLKFNETITNERVFLLLKDIQGLDVQNLQISVFDVLCTETSGNVERTYVYGTTHPLKFYPKRFKTRISASQFVQGRQAKDDGEGRVFGDFVGRGRINTTTEYPVSKNCFAFGNFMAIVDSTTSGVFKILDLRYSEGSLSKMELFRLDGSTPVPVVPLASCWCQRYNEIIVVCEPAPGAIWVLTYPVAPNMFDPESYTYLQMKDTYTFDTCKKGRSFVGSVYGVTSIGAVAYFDSYIYIVLNTSTGGKLIRYRLMAGGIEASPDATFNGTGVLPLSGRDYRSAVIVENAFGDGRNVMCLSSIPTTGLDESCLDVVVDVTNPTACYFEADFFRASLVTYNFPIEFWGLSVDLGTVYAVANLPSMGGKSVIMKLYSLAADGTVFTKILSTADKEYYRSAVYNFHNSISEVYVVDVDEKKVVKVGADANVETPVTRLQTGVGETSITLVANILYETLELRIAPSPIMLTNATVSYEPEDGLRYSGNQIAALERLDIKTR